MTRNARRFDDLMNRAFAPYRDIPREEVNAASEHVRRDLRDDADARTRIEMSDADTHVRGAWLRPVLACAAAAVLAVVVFARPWAGDPLATAVADGAYELVDGSRVEVRPQTSLSFERADDGLRILLEDGGIIVNAAKQRTGHLYVHTKDVTVSVVGTVFLVNVEPEGSRVAVIEGEVRVRQGASEKKLLPGDQMATSPGIHLLPVVEEIAWSRNAPEHHALLLQSRTAAQASVPAVTPDTPAPRERFEVVSIRLRGVSTDGGRGGGAALACAGGMDLDPRLLRLRGFSVYRMITLAHDGDCLAWTRMSEPGPLSGGPEWVRFDLWDVEARIPEGPLPYTPGYVDIGGGRTAQRHTPGPRLKAMLEDLLADRFKLRLRRETRQVPGYVLTVAKGGPKMIPWKEGDPTTERELVDAWAQRGMFLSPQELSALGLTAAEFADRWTRRAIELRPPGQIGAKASLAYLVSQIQRATLRPVLDRTGLTGEFNYRLAWDETFEQPPDVLVPRRPGAAAAGTRMLSGLVEALERDLGLRLEPTQTAADVLIIEQVERPTEN